MRFASLRCEISSSRPSFYVALKSRNTFLSRGEEVMFSKTVVNAFWKNSLFIFFYVLYIYSLQNLRSYIDVATYLTFAFDYRLDQFFKNSWITNLDQFWVTWLRRTMFQEIEKSLLLCAMTHRWANEKKKDCSLNTRAETQEAPLLLKSAENNTSQDPSGSAAISANFHRAPYVRLGGESACLQVSVGAVPQDLPVGGGGGGPPTTSLPPTSPPTWASSFLNVRGV